MTTDPPLLPLFLDLRGRRVVVVGGGTIARRKIEPLLSAGARVLVVAPEIEPAIVDWRDGGALEVTLEHFIPNLLDDAWLVIAATDDAAVNTAVADAAGSRRVWCNVVDDAPLCSVQMPARIERGALQVAISSGGHAPMLARHLRERLERELDESFDALSALLVEVRGRIRTRWPDLDARRRLFDRILDGRLQAQLRRGEHIAARRALDALIDDNAGTLRGHVALVGAGPGDAGLLTLRGLRLLNQADVILHDKLIGDDVLALARRDATRIDIGKRAGAHAASQDTINALLVEHALAGARVVRLKGGDPFVFGRGGEELEVLRAHGIDYEVVPGVTAALACAAYAGIPLTHRDHAQSVQFVTAHGRGDDMLDWTSLARVRHTLVFYMGVGALDTVATQLIAHGRGTDTPFALVERGTHTDQRVITGPLHALPAIAHAHEVHTPALLIVGEVAAFADTLHWFGALPLHGMPDSAFDIAA